MLNSTVLQSMTCDLAMRGLPGYKALSCALALTLCGCLGNTGSPAPAPSGVQAWPGDGVISITWQDNPTIDYWIFYAQDPELTTVNWYNLLNANDVEDTTSPTIICGLINNPDPQYYYPAYFFTLNARTGTAPGGIGSQLVSAAPRPAGGSATNGQQGSAEPAAPWISGASIPANIAGMGYASITSCGYAGRPPWGMYVAVGPGSAIYSGLLTPNVAGPLTTEEGNQAIVWLPGNVPPGFNANLTSVAGYAASGNDPAAPSLNFVAVGKQGAVMRSADGYNWQVVSGIPTTQNLNAVTATGSGFIAVGDNGTILTSGNGLAWTLYNNTYATVPQNNLNAIHCIGFSCVAVGDSGTTLWSSNGGLTWTYFPYGNNNWNGIAYGNADFNADALVTFAQGVSTTTVQNAYISTWVVTDALGNFAYARATGAWASTNVAIAPSIVAIDYTTRFVALDAAGNAYASENGLNWQAVGSSGVTNPIGMVSNGVGFVTVGNNGATASSF